MISLCSPGGAAEHCHTSVHVIPAPITCLLTTAHAVVLTKILSRCGRNSTTAFGVELVLNRTIANYFSYCREVCTWSVECKLATDGKISGVGMTVEIDESKFGKRKYQRGRLIEGQWVLGGGGGICRKTREIFLVALPENKRNRQC